MNEERTHERTNERTNEQRAAHDVNQCSLTICECCDVLAFASPPRSRSDGSLLLGAQAVLLDGHLGDDETRTDVRAP